MAARDFLEKPAGKVVAGLLVIAGLIAAYYTVRDTFGGSASANDRVFVCSETLKSFHYTIKEGDTIPVESPFTCRKTGYPPEVCLWSKDGSIRQEPYYVLLNSTLGKRGLTFCPDCGRLVIANNPSPNMASKAPPTQAQLMQMTQQQASQYFR